MLPYDRMGSLLLHTKFLIPRPRPNHLPRRRLLNRLNETLTKRLGIIAAPTGYGKTTLLASFARDVEAPLIWYQLDAGDNDPTVFLQYLVEGVRRRFPAFGRATLSLLDDPEVEIDRVLMVLLNDVIGAVEDDFLIVLEDYHCIENNEIHRIVEFVLEHQPPNMHLLLSTRVEPALALARLRARGELVELSVQDLRFTQDEVAAVTADLPLAEPQIRMLEERTEGWAAGLQLAMTTLAQHSHHTADDVIGQFRGSNRYIFDYLAQEVFEQQPADVRDFLLQSAVLSQMSAEICDRVLETDGSQEKLEYLERQNLFLVSLDDERHWYRYHQLFRDFLLNRLYRDAESEALRLHATAGDFYAEQARWDLAAEHYSEARNTDGLAQAVRALAPAYLQSGRVETLQRYMEVLPAGFVDSEPDFLLFRGHVCRYRGRIDDAVACYEQACALYRSRGDSAMVCHALTHQARVLRSQGRYRDARRLAQTAVEHAGADDHAERAEALMALAKSAGFLDGMAEGYRLGESALEEAELASDTLSPGTRARLLWSQAQLAWWYGDPFATVAHCQAALAASSRGDDDLSPLACRIFTVMATPYLYWGKLDKARELAAHGVELSEQLQFTEWLPMAYATLGNVLSRQNELDDGRALLERAIGLSRELGVESYAQLMASGYLAFNLAQAGNLVEARQACEEALHLHANSAETYELCVCQSVLGDLLLDMGDLDTAEEYFRNLRRICEARQFRIPLAMVYFALGYLHLDAGRRDAALKLIRRSIETVRHTDAVQLFVDQGQRAQIVCRAARDAGVYPEFAQRVLAALPSTRAPVPEQRDDMADSANDTPTQDTNVVDVICLGGFRLFHGEQELGKEVGLTGKPRELLAYFITYRNQRLSLDRVIEDLWPGSDPDKGQAVFHTTLYRLRRALTRTAGTGDYICHESGEYTLESERFRVDADRFDALVNVAQAGSGVSAIEAAQAAVELYSGPYLPTLYEEWVEGERRRLISAYLTVLRLLSAQHAAAGDYHDAVAACERILDVDPLQESVHRDLMRFWHRLGNRAAVERQYEQVTAILAEELDAEPLPETQALYHDLTNEAVV